MIAAVLAVTLLAVLPLAVVKAPNAMLDRLGWTRMSVRLAAMELTFLAVAGGYLVVAGEPSIGYAVPSLSALALVPVAVAAGFGVGGATAALFEAVGVDTSANASALDGGPEADGESERDADGAGSRSLPALLAVSLLVGPAEELLYRGVVQGTFAAVVHPAVAVVAASVLFGVVHYPSHGADSWRDVNRGALVGMTISGTGGLVYGSLYVLTGNLVVPALAHSLHVALLFTYLTRSASADHDEGAGTSVARGQ